MNRYFLALVLARKIKAAAMAFVVISFVSQIGLAQSVACNKALVVQKKVQTVRKHDQGCLNSCWVESAVLVMEQQLSQKLNRPIELSADYLYAHHYAKTVKFLSEQVRRNTPIELQILEKSLRGEGWPGEAMLLAKEVGLVSASTYSLPAYKKSEQSFLQMQSSLRAILHKYFEVEKGDQLKVHISDVGDRQALVLNLSPTKKLNSDLMAQEMNQIVRAYFGELPRPEFAWNRIKVSRLSSRTDYQKKIDKIISAINADKLPVVAIEWPVDSATYSSANGKANFYADMVKGELSAPEQIRDVQIKWLHAIAVIGYEKLPSGETRLILQDSHNTSGPHQGQWVARESFLRHFLRSVELF